MGGLTVPGPGTASPHTDRANLLRSPDHTLPATPSPPTETAIERGVMEEAGGEEGERRRKARVPESPKTYRVGIMWLTLTNLMKGFSFVRFLIFSLLIALVTCDVVSSSISGQDWHQSAHEARIFARMLPKIVRARCEFYISHPGCGRVYMQPYL